MKQHLPASSQYGGRAVCLLQSCGHSAVRHVSDSQRGLRVSPCQHPGNGFVPMQLHGLRPGSGQTMQLSHIPPCCRDFARFRGPPAECNPSDSLQFVLEPGVTECSAAPQPRQRAEHAQRAQTSNQAGAAGETAGASAGVGLEQAGHGASLRKGSSAQDASSGNTTGSVPALENIVVRKRTRWALGMGSGTQREKEAAVHGAWQRVYWSGHSAWSGAACCTACLHSAQPASSKITADNVPARHMRRALAGKRSLAGHVVCMFQHRAWYWR